MLSQTKCRLHGTELICIHPVYIFRCRGSKIWRLPGQRYSIVLRFFINPLSTRFPVACCVSFVVLKDLVTCIEHFRATSSIIALLATSSIIGLRATSSIILLLPTRTPSPSIPSSLSTSPLGFGVVPQRLLTFRGSLYKEVAKTSSWTLVYRFERQTARKNISSFQKQWVLDLECRILSQEPSGSCILYFNMIFLEK